MLIEIVFPVLFPTLNAGFILNLTFNTLSPSHCSNTAVLNLGRTMDSLGSLNKQQGLGLMDLLVMGAAKAKDCCSQ